MTFSNYLEQELLDEVFGGVAFAVPAVIAVQLHTGDPGENCTANVATNDVRKAVTFTAGTNPIVTDSAASWTAGETETETITHVSTWDSATAGAGNPLAYGALAASRAVTAGDTFDIPATDLTVALD